MTPITPKPQGTCDKCKWFEIDAMEPRRGFCHRYPPTLTHITVITPPKRQGAPPDIEIQNRTSNPIVLTTNWCGEWTLNLLEPRN
jgi:hypothetical protein